MAKAKANPKFGGRGAKPALNDELRREVVTRLAMYDSVKDIQESLAGRGIEISTQAISNYNPTSSNGTSGLAAKWVELFHETREQWLKATAAEPIAHRSYRLRYLGKICERAYARGDLARAQSALEQAAKEVGNVYTNVAKVQGTVASEPPERSPEEARNMLADRLAEALSRLPKKSGDLTKH